MQSEYKLYNMEFQVCYLIQTNRGVRQLIQIRCLCFILKPTDRVKVHSSLKYKKLNTLSITVIRFSVDNKIILNPFI